MSKLEKAILRLQEMQTGESVKGFSDIPDCRASLIVTILYLGVMLSVPLANLQMLIWFAIYPILAAPISGISFGSVMRKSLFVLPFVIFIGIFNPIFDHEISFHAGSIAVSRGWVTFISVTLRGMMAVQAVLVLIESNGFNGMCLGMQRLGIPAFLITQLNLIFRYLGVMLSEALDMKRAREARGYGNKTMPLKMWGAFIGELFIRTVSRAERVHCAMQARGFEGTIRFYNSQASAWKLSDTLTVFSWSLLFALLRIFNISALFTFIHY